ncbi:MAG: hypothetical protein WA080_07730 [Sulfuricurvum sp.]
MIDNLKEAFATVESNACLETTREKVFEIVDDEVRKRSVMVKEGQFKVNNPQQKLIHFLAVDSCVFSDSDGSRCDCMVFDEVTCCFIELKSCKNKNEPKHRQKAKEQLKTTIEFLKEKIDLSLVGLEAYICIACTPASIKPRIENMNAIAEFAEKLDTKLRYGCEKVFE